METPFPIISIANSSLGNCRLRVLINMDQVHVANYQIA
jgi:hypothetical protein